MTEEEKLTCPKCGMLVSKGDRFCKNCGATLIEVSTAVPAIPPAPEIVPEERYERKFSLIQRFLKVLTKPSEAMKDIGLAPDYGGSFAVIAIEMVLASVAVILIFQRIQLVGTYAEEIWNFVVGIMTLGIVIAFGLVIARWLIKSLIVKFACDSGSSWDFKTAASITGYAYVADIVTSLLGIIAVWLFMPSFVIDVTNLDAARQAIADYQAQMLWVKLAYTLPVSLLGLIWKSYLGGLGAHFGTKERCSRSTGIVVFFALGLIGLLISFAFSW